MNQSKEFKSNFEANQVATNLEDASLEIESKDAEYPIASNARNVCFEMKDGRKILFNYAYLISVELIVQETKNTLIVSFSAQKVLIKGVNLYLLFQQFMQHIPRIISIAHPRYILDKTAAAIWEIELLKS